MLFSQEVYVIYDFYCWLFCLYWYKHCFSSIYLAHREASLRSTKHPLTKTTSVMLLNITSSTHRSCSNQINDQEFPESVSLHLWPFLHRYTPCLWKKGNTGMTEHFGLASSSSAPEIQWSWKSQGSWTSMFEEITSKYFFIYLFF